MKLLLYIPPARTSLPQKQDAFNQSSTFFPDKPGTPLLPHRNHRKTEGDPVTVRAYTDATSYVFFLNGAPAARNRECTPVAGNIAVTVLPSPAQANQTGEATKSPALPLFAKSTGLAFGILTVEIPAKGCSVPIQRYLKRYHQYGFRKLCRDKMFRLRFFIYYCNEN
ncbi:MAG: hypothetical protein SOZ43_00015 [Eubacteriales bacterium]|nr:hypothetical protein [Eubacteriales bacterium]